MKKVAVLLDGAYVLKSLYRILKTYPTAEQVWDYAIATIKSDSEELFRIYFYDCPPSEEQLVNPISRRNVNFSNTDTSRRCRTLHDKLRLMDYVAFRRGELSLHGWKLKDNAINDLIQSNRAITEHDLTPDFEQKLVDMKIGLDVAWLASKRIVDRIILVTGDSDFIPAMKFARTEGIQVVLVTMGGRTRPQLREHADELRKVAFAGSLF